MLLKCPNCGEQDEVKVTKIPDTQGFTEPSQKSESKWKWIATMIAALLAVMLFTKPDKSKHVEKVRGIAMGMVSEKVGSRDDDFTKGLAMLFGPFVINQFLEMGMQIDDYVFFNVGRIKYNDTDKPVTIGVFNAVLPLVNTKSLSQQVKDEPGKEMEKAIALP